MSLDLISHGTVTFTNNQPYNYPTVPIPGAVDPARRPIVVLSGSPSPGNVNMNYWIMGVSYSGGRWQLLVGRSNHAGSSAVDFTVVGTKAV